MEHRSPTLFVIGSPSSKAPPRNMGMYAMREIVFREFWGRGSASRTRDLDGWGSTYRELAERVSPHADTKDLGGTTGDRKKCGLQGGEAKGFNDQKVLYTNTSDQAAKGGPEEECQSLRILDRLPKPTQSHQCADFVADIEPKLTGVA